MLGGKLAQAGSSLEDFSASGMCHEALESASEVTQQAKVACPYKLDNEPDLEPRVEGENRLLTSTHVMT